MPTLQIGLNKPGGGPKGSSKPAPAKRKPIFGDDDEEDHENPDLTSAPQSSARNGFQEITTFDDTTPPPPSTATSEAQPAQKNAKPALKPKFALQEHSTTAPNLSALRTQTQHTADVDPSLYDYDAAYDALHSKPAKKATAQGGGGQEAQYMNDLLQAAEVRKRDQLRAKERLLQKEREAEGEEFKDKDMFVTEAYKAQQEEVRKAEEAEKDREASEAKRRDKGMGMASFYRGFMEQEEQKHKEMVEAAASAPKAGSGADNAASEAAAAEKSDIEKARELKERGKDVVINEEGQVLDKRELLSAGLNVAPKPKAADAQKAGFGTATSQQQGPLQGNRGRGDAHKAMRERQTRMMEAQLEQAAKRAAEDEAEEQAKLERAAKSQKTEGDISSARERYLQRKREAAAASGK